MFLLSLLNENVEGSVKLLLLKPSFCGKRAQCPLSLHACTCTWCLQYAEFFKREIYKDGKAQQNPADQIGAEDIAGPVVSQVNTGRADQHHESGRDHQQGSKPPVPSLEEDDTESEEQSPVRYVGHYMTTGEAVSQRRLNDMDEMARWTWPTDLGFDQEVEEQAHGRKPSNE